ncbi:MAG: sulfurtransferase TusA family protein [Chloroflexi bacterium]|nr:sulfurtransferase TusA family protein [Chloroflexota bacterium]
MQLTTPSPDKTLDLSGLRCPHLVVATVKALRTLERGQILQVIATDLNSPSNMTAWSRQSGHQLLELYDEDGRFFFFFERGEETAVLFELEETNTLSD